MASFNLGDLTASLATDVKGSGVSFLGKALKWETEEQVKSLLDAINECKDLQFLELEGNTLGVEAAKRIGDALKSHPELKKALWKDLFTGRMKTEIPIALKHLGEGMTAAGAHLTVLDCSDNALGPNGMTGLVDLLKSPTCFSLEELKLNNCGLGIGGGRMLAQALLECHRKSVIAGTPLALKVFIAGRNRLENDGARALSEVFAAVKTLEHIAIPQNGIYHAGIGALSDALKQNPNLKVLNLNDNTIGPKGALSLSEAFYSLQKLQEINFGDCLLKTRGAIALAEALMDEHQELEVLNFGFNEIKADGGMSIATAMGNKKLLKSLEIDGNAFGTEGREQIKDILEKYSKSDVLGSLEEDASEDEESDEDQQSGSEEEEEEGSDEGEAADSDYDQDETYGESTLERTQEQPLDFSTVSVSDEKDLSDPVESFCVTQFPSEEQFRAIRDENKATAFRDYLKTLSTENYFTYLTFAIIKCSEFAEKHKDALDIAEALYEDAFKYAKTENKLSVLRNFILIQCGLLKSEDKNFRPRYNVQGCRFALASVLKKDFIPADEKNIIQLFLDQHRAKA